MARGKFSRLCTKHIIHWKTLAMHQAGAIMYCTQQLRLAKICENRKVFSLETFAVYNSQDFKYPVQVSYELQFPLFHNVESCATYQSNCDFHYIVTVNLKLVGARSLIKTDY